MAFARREVARGDAATRLSLADQHRLWNDTVRYVAEAHPASGLQAKDFQPFKERSVRIEGCRLLPSRHAEIACTDDHQRHGGIDAGHLGTVDRVDALARREDMTGDRTPRIEEVEQDGRRGAG